MTAHSTCSLISSTSRRPVSTICDGYMKAARMLRKDWRVLGGAAIRPRKEAMHDDTSRLLVTSVVSTLDERERCLRLWVLESACLGSAKHLTGVWIFLLLMLAFLSFPSLWYYPTYLLIPSSYRKTPNDVHGWIIQLTVSHNRMSSFHPQCQTRHLRSTHHSHLHLS